MNLEETNNFVFEIKGILNFAKQQVYSVVNSAMVQAYWLIGKRIVEEEQNGKERAEYGKQIIKTLSDELTNEFGKGFSITNLKYFRQFYLAFHFNSLNSSLSMADEKLKSHTLSDLFNTVISHTVCDQSEKKIMQILFAKLNWSQIRLIMRVSNLEAQNYYIKETAKNSWSVRTLDRNISTQYYERLFLSHAKASVKKEMEEKSKELQTDKNEFIKSPAVLEFLNLPANIGYTESELENAIINNLQQFILELGKGYAFVEMQQLIRTEKRDYFIDLVFYNYILKCFILIDLKTERITHQDVGQMDMYVRMYDENKKEKNDNPTIGIVLCSETDYDIARYSILKGNEQLFASKYKLYLPSEDELRAEIEREKLNFKLQMGNNE